MKVELMGVLKVIEDDGTITIINEGDYVTCCVGENQYYVGTLSRIGYWQTDKTETFPVAIAIESKNLKTIYASNVSNVILLSDIKWICKINKDEKEEIEKLFSKVKQIN